MSFFFIDSTARAAWAAATSKTGQLTGLRDVWAGQMHIKHYSSAGTLLATAVHATPVVDTGTWELVPGAYVSQTVWTPGTAAYCICQVPAGADILRADSTWDAVDPTISDPGGRVRVDIGTTLRIQATASLPATDAPAWSVGLSADTWTAISGTQFFSWADGGGITPAAYRGTDPFANMVDAYCDMCQAPDGMIYIYGGGHGDGTCNAVVKCDPADFSYTVVGPPTPPSVYLADYPSPSAIYYPSGLQFSGWFLPSSILTDPADSAHVAPELARVATHMYGAAVATGGAVHYTYLSYGAFNTTTGEWSGRTVDLGAQLNAIFSNYGTPPLQIRTMGVYDTVTGLIFLTFIPGTDGGGWRDGIIVFDPATSTILSTNEGGATFGVTKDWVDLKIVGRKLYVFTNTGTDPGPFTMNQGYICDLDDLATKTGRNALAAPTTKAFTITGDTAGGVYSSSSGKDSIPSFYDGTNIWRWNYGANLNKLYKVDLTPVSGDGSVASPWVLQQTERTISGTITGPTGAEVWFVYSRLFWHEPAGCAIVIPRASSDWYALKLS